MNLLYLTILLPFIAFLILNYFGARFKRTESVWAIGLCVPILTVVILIYCLIDFHHLASILPEAVYPITLWHWIEIDSLNVNIGFYIDMVSMFFCLLLVSLVLFVLPFAGIYLQTKEEVYRFFGYANLLLSMLFLLILADNFLLLILSWQAISYCSYLMMSLKNKIHATSSVAIRQLVLMHLTDLFLLIAICLIFTHLSEFNIQKTLALASENLAVDSSSIYFITLFLFLAVISRVGLFPFQLIFTNTTKASMPVLTLLQIGTALLAGGYLMLRVEPLFYMSNDLLFIIGAIAMITILISGSVALVKHDLKRIVSYFNLLQISTFFLVFTVQDSALSLTYILGYTLTSLFILILTGLLIQSCNGERNIEKLGGLYRKQPFLFGCFIAVFIALSSFPWISSFYYLKLNLIATLVENQLIFLAMILLLSSILTLLILARMIIKIFFGAEKTQSHTLHYFHHFAVCILGFCSLGGFLVIPSLFFNRDLFALDAFSFNSYQLLFIGVVMLAIFIAYFFFVSKNADIAVIAKTPLAKRWLQWANKEGYLNEGIAFISISFIGLITKITLWHPILKITRWAHKKNTYFHFSTFFERKKGITKELMSLMICCLIVVLLLTFI